MRTQLRTAFFPCSADHERDRPPCKVVFFGLATNTLNVRFNQQQQQLIIIQYCCTTSTNNAPLSTVLTQSVFVE